MAVPRLADVKPEITVDHRSLASLARLFGTRGSQGGEFVRGGWGTRGSQLPGVGLSWCWVCARRGNVTHVSEADVPEPVGGGFVPGALSPQGVLCPEQGQGDTASAVYPVVPGIVVTPDLMPPPCPGMALLPSRGAVARPHPSEAGTMGGRHFLSHKGLVVNGPDGISAVTDPVSVRWSRAGSSGHPVLQILMDSGQGTHTRLGAGAGAGW